MTVPRVAHREGTKTIDGREYQYGYLIFECPGCGFLHAPTVSGDRPGRPVWQWNGSLELPTIAPSLLVRAPYGDPPRNSVCHSFIRDGRIEFLSDCTHALAGHTVDLPLIVSSSDGDDV